MRKSTVKRKLSRDEPVLVTQLHLTDPSIFEMTSLLGFDAIWMDLEHHTYSLETAAQLMRAARVGAADVLARPARGEFPRLSRMLEAGAQGIMYPRCGDAEEAAEVVRWAKFPPLGRRGLDGGNPDMPYLSAPVEQYTREANEETFLVIQLEDQNAVDRAAEIAAVDGVDVLMLGPADFSLERGIPGQFDHPTIREATQEIARAAAQAGKHWGCPAFSVEHGRALLEQGARMLFHGADIVMVKSGLEDVQRQFASLGFTFRNELG